MENIESLIIETLKFFPEVIDITDGELRTDNGFFSQTLSNTWHNAMDKNEAPGNDVDFMIWTIYGLLHKKSRENFENGIYKVMINEIKLKDIENEYQQVLKEAQ